MNLKKTILATTLMLGFFATAIWLQSGMLRRLRANPEIYRDTLYVPSSEYVKWITLGYDQLAADLLWMRSIQTFGATYANKENLPPLINYFNAISDLDPRFVPVYSFANMVLGEEAGDAKLGLEVIDRGMINVPRFYRIPFEGAFFSLWTINEPEKAKYYIRMAAKDPNCPAWVKGWEAYLDVKQGRHMAAFQKYFADYATHVNAKDAQMASLRRDNLRRVIRDWHKAEIRRMATDFASANGRFPSLAELEATGAMAGMEAPDWEKMSQFIAFTESNGVPYPADTEELNALALRFVRKGWQEAPRDPVSDNPHFQKYLIWPGQQPMTFDEKTQKTVDNRFFVMAELEAAKTIVEHFGLASMMANLHMKHTGATECPASLTGIYDENITKRFEEPWGGQFIWDPKTCEFISTTHPDLQKQFRQGIDR